jgi:hypothetical protein
VAVDVHLENGSRRERSLLAIGAGATVFGIALSVGQESSVASVMTLLGLLSLIVGLHRFGRSGPDLAQKAPPKKRKRRSS